MYFMAPLLQHRGNATCENVCCQMANAFQQLTVMLNISRFAYMYIGRYCWCSIWICIRLVFVKSLMTPVPFIHYQKYYGRAVADWEGTSNFIPTLYQACDYLFMLRLKLIHVSKRGPWCKGICKSRFLCSLVVASFQKRCQYHGFIHRLIIIYQLIFRNWRSLNWCPKIYFELHKCNIRDSLLNLYLGVYLYVCIMYVSKWWW